MEKDVFSLHGDQGSAHRDRSTLTFPFQDSADRKTKEKTHSVLMWLMTYTTDASEPDVA